MAMALASMNPMVGTSTNNGSYFINVLNHDKDLSDNNNSLWKSKNYVSNTLDTDDSMIGLDKNNKLKAMKKKDIIGENDTLLIYTIKGDNVFDMLMEDIKKPYEDREIRDNNFMEQFVLGHDLYSIDQLDYEPLLEKVELDKFSSVISGEADNMKAQFTGLKQTKKKAGYTPDSFPQGTEDMNKIPVLCAADVLLRNSILKEYPNYITIYEDSKGFYGYNEMTGIRTSSNKNMSKLYLEVLL